MNPKETTKIESIANQILYSTDFSSLTIEQKYAVLNKVRKEVNNMRDKRNSKRLEELYISLNLH